MTRLLFLQLVLSTLVLRALGQPPDPTTWQTYIGLGQVTRGVKNPRLGDAQTENAGPIDYIAMQPTNSRQMGYSGPNYVVPNTECDDLWKDGDNPIVKFDPKQGDRLFTGSGIVASNRMIMYRSGQDYRYKYVGIPQMVSKGAPYAPRIPPGEWKRDIDWLSFYEVGINEGSGSRVDGDNQIMANVTQYGIYRIMAQWIGMIPTPDSKSYPYAIVPESSGFVCFSVWVSNGAEADDGPESISILSPPPPTEPTTLVPPVSPEPTVAKKEDEGDNDDEEEEDDPRGYVRPGMHDIQA